MPTPGKPARPSHSPEPPRPGPPPENGLRLAAIPRGTLEELRVNLSEYEGRPYISLRVFGMSRSDGAWWPQPRKGCSIRVAEIDRVVEALREAQAVLEREREQAEAREQELAARREQASQGWYSRVGHRPRGERS